MTGGRDTPEDEGGARREIEAHKTTEAQKFQCFKLLGATGNIVCVKNYQDVRRAPHHASSQGWGSLWWTKEQNRPLGTWTLWLVDREWPKNIG